MSCQARIPPRTQHFFLVYASLVLLVPCYQLMASIFDEQMKWFYFCICHTLPWCRELREYMEQRLKFVFFSLNFLEGFGGALSKVAANRELPLGLRQISFFWIELILLLLCFSPTFPSLLLFIFNRRGELFNYC